MAKILDENGNIKSGRRKGTKVTDESKDKARASNPNKKQIKTPFGTFNSRDECSKATGFSRSLIGYYCYMGDRQRNGDLSSKYNSRTGKAYPDYTEWETELKIIEVIPVHTPMGDFPSIQAAARASGVTAAYICQVLKYQPKHKEIYKI
jgi:hypothetical protein